mgnify:CR=1 FL=1|tara:strand:+ start:139658 stop:139801 length:144 start_codon:yes stop_codon:yes gene_type:complete
MAGNINTNSLEVTRHWEGYLWDFIIEQDLEDEFKEFLAVKEYEYKGE